jgi:hypothetical protein
MKNFKKNITAFVLALSCLSNANAQANNRTTSGINGINNNQMPNRISMNVTVGKQTLRVAIADGGCVISDPAQKAYWVNTATNTMTEISQAEFGDKVNAGKQTQGATFGEKVNAGLQQAGGALASGASLVGGAMPGGSIISAAVSAVSSRTNTGGASSAAYAATGRVSGWNIKTNETRLELPENLADGDYELTFVIAENDKNGLKDTLKTQVRLGFALAQGVLKTKHDTVKNSISNVR